MNFLKKKRATTQVGVVPVPGDVGGLSEVSEPAVPLASAKPSSL